MGLLVFLFFAAQFETTFRAGLVALNENNLKLAESHLEAASQLQPRDARVWLALAQTYWKLHKLPAAQTAAATAEKLAADANTWRGLALHYWETANYRKAINSGQKALDAEDRADLHNLLGKAYAADGNAAAAVAEFQAAIRANSFEESYHFDLAQLQLKQQNFAAALDTIQSARRNFDRSAQLELAAGVAYYGLRRFPDAIDAFLRMIRLDPAIEQPYVFLGRMLDQAEDKLPQIVEVFAVLAKRAPDNYLSTFLYGKALRLEDPDRAEALLRQAIRRNGGFWESHFELGALLDQRQKFEEAAGEMRRSIELNPSEPAPHYRLARLYDRLGKRAEARAERELHAKLSAGASAAMMK